MKKECEIKDMLKLLNSDIANYQQMHQDAISEKNRFPRYNNSFQDSVTIFKAQKQILLWVLEEEMNV